MRRFLVLIHLLFLPLAVFVQWYFLFLIGGNLSPKIALILNFSKATLLYFFGSYLLSFLFLDKIDEFFFKFYEKRGGEKFEVKQGFGKHQRRLHFISLFLFYLFMKKKNPSLEYSLEVYPFIYFLIFFAVPHMLYTFLCRVGFELRINESNRVSVSEFYELSYKNSAQSFSRFWSSKIKQIGKCLENEEV